MRGIKLNETFQTLGINRKEQNQALTIHDVFHIIKFEILRMLYQGDRLEATQTLLNLKHVGLLSEQDIRIHFHYISGYLSHSMTFKAMSKLFKALEGGADEELPSYMSDALFTRRVTLHRELPECLSYIPPDVYRKVRQMVCIDHAAKSHYRLWTEYDRIHDRQLLLHAIWLGQTSAAVRMIEMNEIQDKYESVTTVLIEACRAGYDEIVAKLLARGTSVNQQDKMLMTALHVASLYGMPSIVEMLLRAGADVNTIDSQGNTPLNSACDCGNMGIVKKLIQHGAQVNVQAGISPLVTASAKGYVDIVTYLIESHSNLNTQDEDGRTALMEACVAGHPKIVKLLFEAGADPFFSDHDEITALNHAFFAGSEACVDYLLSVVRLEEFDPNVQNKSGRTALMVCARKGKARLVRILLSAGIASIHIQDKSRMNAIMWAASSGQDDIVEMLLDAKAGIDVTNSKNQTALMLACLGGHTIVVDVLIRHGANIHMKDKWGWNALNHAYSMGHNAIASTLEALGAKPDVHARKDKYDTTVLMHAAYHGYCNVFKSLIDAGSDINAKSSWYNKSAVELAAFQEKHAAVEELIMLGANVSLDAKSVWSSLNIMYSKNRESFFRESLLKFGKENTSKSDDDTLNFCLSSAVSDGFDGLFELLLDIGGQKCSEIIVWNDNSFLFKAVESHQKKILEALLAHEDRRCIDAHSKSGQTALMLAARLGYKDIVCMFFQAGADINEADHYGWTPLNYAYSGRDTSTVDAIISYGGKADINKKDEQGWTSLMWASYCGNIHNVERLISSQADVHVEDEYGRTALILAVEEFKRRRWEQFWVYPQVPNINLIRQLIDAGVDVNVRDKSCDRGKRTALEHAAERGGTDAVRLLAKAMVESGTDLDFLRNSDLMIPFKIPYMDTWELLEILAEGQSPLE